jgi:D-arginine dehydrogenase
MQTKFDIIVIGAGIAGASIAAHLAAEAKVAILEMEDRPGYHTTGRSAASYEPNYGPPPMLAFTRASAAFFKNPPLGFADGPLLTPRSSLFLEAEGQHHFTEKLLAHGANLEEISEHQATALYPILRQGYAKRSFLDSHTGDLDVDLLHRGYLRMFKAAGGTLAASNLAKTIVRQNSIWNIITPFEQFSAPIIVNATGAWGDEIAKLAGVKPIGLTPKRRSIGVIQVNGHPDFANWPMVTDNAETWYAKPQSGKLIVSSADATPVEPHDAYADDMAIAEGIERLMTATTLEVTHLDHSWGGLRSFAPDGNPVIGFDPSTEGFFWLIGQGGYGIQSAPALSRAAAALALRKPIPIDVLEAGLNRIDILPDRLRVKT